MNRLFHDRLFLFSFSFSSTNTRRSTESPCKHGKSSERFEFEHKFNVESSRSSESFGMKILLFLLRNRFVLVSFQFSSFHFPFIEKKRTSIERCSFLHFLSLVCRLFSEMIFFLKKANKRNLLPFVGLRFLSVSLVSGLVLHAFAFCSWSLFVEEN